MPVTAGDRNILIITAALFLVLVGVTLFLNRGVDSGEQSPTVYSAASGGAKAAYLLLQRSGFKTTTWEQPLSEIGEGKGKTLILADPYRYPSTEEQNEVKAFLESGGHVIATGRLAGFYLSDNKLNASVLPKATWSEYDAQGLSPITRVARKITLNPQAYWDPGTAAVTLYGDGIESVVVQYKVGAGDVLWTAAATPLTNAGIQQPDNLEFFLAAVGNPEQNEILWDEYVHGYVRTPPRHIRDRMLSWITVQFGICALAILFAYSRRSGPIWMPSLPSRLSPLEFVRTLGSLYDHANAGAVAIEVFYLRFRYLLTKRLGLPITASVADLERTVRDRWSIHEDAFGQTLRECESYRYDSTVEPKTALRLVQALFDFATRMHLIGKPREERKSWKRS